MTVFSLENIASSIFARRMLRRWEDATHGSLVFLAKHAIVFVRRAIGVLSERNACVAHHRSCTKKNAKYERTRERQPKVGCGVLTKVEGEAHLPPAGLTSMFTGVVISIARSCVLLPNRYPAKVLKPSPDPVVIPGSLLRALSS